MICTPDSPYFSSFIFLVLFRVTSMSLQILFPSPVITLNNSFLTTKFTPSQSPLTKWVSYQHRLKLFHFPVKSTFLFLQQENHILTRSTTPTMLNDHILGEMSLILCKSLLTTSIIWKCFPHRFSYFLPSIFLNTLSVLLLM